MRAVIQFLFLSFYVVSSFVTTVHRTAHVVHKVRHSSTASESPALENCKERVRYTHFREAKKAGANLYYYPEQCAESFRLLPAEQLAPDETSHRQQFDVEISHSRAPPKN